MEYARLGSTGTQVSRICLGCMGFGDAEHWVHKWVLDEENSWPIIKKALELGITFFDTANVYSIGATKITHLEDAVGALSVKLTQEEVAHLEAPYVPHRIVGHQ